MQTNNQCWIEKSVLLCLAAYKRMNNGERVVSACGVTCFLVFSSPTIYCWFILEKANEVHDIKDAEKRIFKTEQ